MRSKTKKGFTLVELLIAVCVFSVIMAISMPMILNYIDDSKHNSITIFENNLRSAGSLFEEEYGKKFVWVSELNENVSCIGIKNLVDYGYIKTNSNVEKYIAQNKSLRFKINSNYVKSVELVDGNVCSTNVLKDMIDIDITVSGRINNSTGSSYTGQWTKESVYLYASVSSNSNLNKYTYQWYKNGSPISGANDNFYIVSINNNNSISDKYTISVSDSFSAPTMSKEFTVNIDKILPTCTLALSNGKLGENNWYIGNPKLKINNSDNSNSIRRFGIKNNHTPDYNGANTIDVGDTATSVYYCYVEDTALNANDNNETSRFIIKADSTAPKITNVGFSNLTCNSETVVVSATDATSGVSKYSFDNGATFTPYNNMTFYTNQTVNIKVKDAAGNIASTTFVVDLITGCSSSGGGGSSSGGSSSGGSSSGTSGDPYATLNNQGSTSYYDKNGNSTGAGNTIVSGSTSDGNISGVRTNDANGTIVFSITSPGTYYLTNESGTKYTVVRTADGKTTVTRGGSSSGSSSSGSSSSGSSSSGSSSSGSSSSGSSSSGSSSSKGSSSKGSSSKSSGSKSSGSKSSGSGKIYDSSVKGGGHM